MHTAGDGRAPTEVEDIALPAGDHGPVLVRIFRPAEVECALPVVLYLSDSTGADDRRPRELAPAARVAVVVPESVSDIETSRQLLRWIVAEGARRRLDGTRVALMGDEVAAELAHRDEIPLWPRCSELTPTPPAP